MNDPNASLRRFAVLHHTGIDEPHYDFLFETADGSQLTTFRVHAWPAFENQLAQKLRDHRRAYLDYAGPISGDRGRVDRVDEGTVQVQRDGESWLLRLPDGRPLVVFQPTGTRPDDPWRALVGESADRARA